jgi:hypothetical protein
MFQVCNLRDHATFDSPSAAAGTGGDPPGGYMAMDEHVTDLPPTSSAATRETEPEVVAGISSAEGSPDLPTDIRVGGRDGGRTVMLLAAGLAFGFGAGWWLRRGG